jgi:hypothetical protein
VCDSAALGSKSWKGTTCVAIGKHRRRRRIRCNTQAPPEDGDSASQMTVSSVSDSGFGTAVRLAVVLLLRSCPCRAIPDMFTLGQNSGFAFATVPASDCLRGDACKYCPVDMDPLACRDRCVGACELNCGAQHDCRFLCLDCGPAVRASTPETRAELLSENRPAFQSSTHGSSHAGLAVDGNTDGNFHRGSCTHTNSDSPMPAWWQVDLDGVASIDEVRIWNRGDCCSDRLRDFEVRLCTTVGCETSKRCGDVVSSAVAPSAMYTAVCEQSTARSVRIVVNNTCTLCEVQVYGRKGHTLRLVATGKVAGASSAVVCPSGKAST